MSSNSQPATSCPSRSRRAAEILHRMLDHWFGPTAQKWRWYKRFPFALAGSATFFLAWPVHILSWTGILSVPDLRTATFLFFVLVGVLGATWFAGITAWKDLSYGPVRLYLSGFLLPYFVWSLIAFMLTRKLPEFAQ